MDSGAWKDEDEEKTEARHCQYRAPPKTVVRSFESFVRYPNAQETDFLSSRGLFCASTVVKDFGRVVL
jgi:hypothetical protein